MSPLTENSILLAPGPVQLHPEVRRILSLPMIHHRTPEFDMIFARTLKNLKFIFQTENPVYIHSSTGSGGMESLLINLLSPGDLVCAIVSGKFGERWADMAEAFGAKVSRILVPWGQSIEPKKIQAHLSQFPNTKIVMTQACETSTATAHPIKELGLIVKEFNALFVVDGITAAGAYPLPMDLWHVDALVAGSQKAFMLPTGASFVSFSKKAWPHVLQAKCPRFYFDIRKEKAANEKGESFFSAPVPLIRALDFVLELLQKISLEKHFSQLQSRAHYTREMALTLGLKIYSQSPSNSLTAYELKPAVDGVQFRTHLEKKYSLTVMGGQDQLKGKIIRIGHMGFISNDDLHQTSLRIAHGLNDFGESLNLNSVHEKSLSLLQKLCEELNPHAQ